MNNELTEKIQKQNKKRNFLLFAAILVALFRIMPIFQGYLRSYGDMAVVFISLIALFPMQKRTFESLIGTAIAAAAFLFFQTLTRNDSVIIDLIKIVRNVCIMILAVYLCDEETNAKDVLSALFWVSLIAITITQITTLIGLEQYPLVARLAINGDSQAVVNEYSGLQAQKLNIGGYAIAYTAPLVTSLLFGIWKQQQTKWFVFFAHVALTIWFLILAQFTMAILLYFVTVFALLLSNGNFKKMFFIALITILLCLFFRNVVSDMFYKFSQTTESSILAGRFEDISDFAAGKDGDDSTLLLRVKAYSTSLKSFIAHPFFGLLLSDGARGGHSAVLDYLATSGLFGFVFLFAAFYSIYKKTIGKYRKTAYFSCVIFSQILFFAAAIVNPIFSETQFWILFIMSAGACEIIKKGKEGIGEDAKEKIPDMQYPNTPYRGRLNFYNKGSRFSR